MPGAEVRPADLLLPLTPLWRLAVTARAAAYRSGLRPVHRAPVPVVSVGNLTFGGTGKTPVVAALVRDLVRRGARPVVLSRGYGRRDAAPCVLVGPDLATAPERCGDEPLELARRLPGVPVVVDADRVRGSGEAVRRHATHLVLDDGFQHLRLARDLDLVLLDAGDPWGGGRLPPRGRLREPLAALSRASAVLVTKLPPDGGERLDEIAAGVARLAPACPVLAARLHATRLRTPDGVLPPAGLAGRKVLAFAGIGRPRGFVELLVTLGAVVVAQRWFQDHHVYTPRDLAELAAEADRHGAVPVTTAKDAVKLGADPRPWVVEVEMVPEGGSWEPLWRLLPGGPP